MIFSGRDIKNLQSLLITSNIRFFFLKKNRANKKKSFSTKIVLSISKSSVYQFYHHTYSLHNRYQPNGNIKFIAKIRIYFFFFNFEKKIYKKLSIRSKKLL